MVLTWSIVAPLVASGLLIALARVSPELVQKFESWAGSSPWERDLDLTQIEYWQYQEAERFVRDNPMAPTDGMSFGKSWEQDTVPSDAFTQYVWQPGSVRSEPLLPMFGPPAGGVADSGDAGYASPGSAYPGVVAPGFGVEEAPGYAGLSADNKSTLAGVLAAYVGLLASGPVYPRERCDHLERVRDQLRNEWKNHPGSDPYNTAFRWLTERLGSYVNRMMAEGGCGSGSVRPSQQKFHVPVGGADPARRVFGAVIGGAWRFSRGGYSVEQMERAVPDAILEWARKRAKAEGREVSKDDLKLPYKNKDGTVNRGGLESALKMIGHVKGVPADVLERARKELERARGPKKEG